MTNILGIRHHGPGCARSLIDTLDILHPDCLLVEGPPEAGALIPDVSSKDMIPPVAILLHDTKDPAHSSFYPFAEYSPEWQTLKWAVTNNCPLRFFDLPHTHTLALRHQDEDEQVMKNPAENQEVSSQDFRGDPFEYFARADGYSDGEKWWNDQIEERSSSPELFTAILEAVTVLREELNLPETKETLMREAWMRRQIRQAEKDGFENIAVVCGAWHAPALVKKTTITSDNALLKNLPRVKISATWSPWTNQRLTTASGYGAGITSPGWYSHLWKNPAHPTVEWITKAARILRKQDLEGSSASIIEAVRLSESLASLRGRPRPGLDETMEAIQSVFCEGDATLLQLLDGPLLIDNKLGSVPEGLAKLPLQADIEAQQKTLRLKPTAGAKEITLDLRDENPRKRSAFLHRMLAIDIPWGEKKQARGKGTFKEIWALQWQPEFSIAYIDASAYGNTLKTAAANKLTSFPENPMLSEITERLDLSLLAELPLAVTGLLHKLQQAAAANHDTPELLQTIIPLCQIARYGNVRKTESQSVLHILNDLVARVCIELVQTASGVDDDAAQQLATLTRQSHHAIGILDIARHIDSFSKALQRIAEHPLAHPLIKGTAVRILCDAGNVNLESLERHFSYALSPGSDPMDAAHWAEGFLSEGAAHLIHKPGLLELIHQWLTGLSKNHFTSTLPLLRRTFGLFSPPERQQISNLISSGAGKLGQPHYAQPASLNQTRSLPAIDTVAKILDLPTS